MKRINWKNLKKKRNNKRMMLNNWNLFKICLKVKFNLNCLKHNRIMIIKLKEDKSYYKFN